LTLQPQQQIPSNSSTTIDGEVEKGFDFIMSHSEGYLTFPRRIVATELLIDQNKKKYQHFKIVLSREQALAHFKRHNYVDCRMNAFPYLKGNILWKPYLLFIDLDLADFKSQISLDLALKKTLKNIKNSLNGSPTVLWSGNGYHVIQPVDCPLELENIKEFEKYKKIVPLLSQEFLRFAKDFLSNGKADKNNYPSFNSCLLRIPGSINSKCLNDRVKRLSGNIKVKVLQKWDRNRVPISRELIEDFRTYLEQKVTDQEISNNNYNNYKYKNNLNQYYSNNNRIEWIEKVLLHPFPDCRKITVCLILASYLINIKKISYDESYRVIKEWLDKCNNLKKLDNYQNFVNYRIHHALKTAASKGIGPISFVKIKTDSRYKDNCTF
jgi:Primase X